MATKRSYFNDFQSGIARIIVTILLFCTITSGEELLTNDDFETETTGWIAIGNTSISIDSSDSSWGPYPS